MPSENEPYYNLSEKDTIQKLKTSLKGLSTLQSKERLGKYGYNLLKEEKGISRLKILISQFTSLLVIILIIASVVSMLLGNLIDTIVILIIVILNGVFGYIQEFRAQKAMKALKKLTQPKSIVIRNNKKMEIESKYIVPGDIVVLEEGTSVPADLRIIKSVNLNIDEANLTGESHPVSKITKAIKGKCVLADRKNMAFMGTIVTYGHGIGVAIKTGMKTEVGKIAKMVQIENDITPLQKTLKRFGKNLGILILAMCAIVVVMGIIRGGEPFDMLLTGIALAVAAIPEGLPAVVTIALAVGLKKMAKKKALVRKLPAVETLGSTSVICSDKTGTLTKNEMTATEVFASNKLYMVTGSGYEPKGSIHLNGKPIDIDKEKSLLNTLRIGLLCNNAEIKYDEKQWKIIGDSTEGALVVLSKKILDSKYVIKNNPRLGEIPFSSERKMMSTINKSGGKPFLLSKGATEVILNKCTKINRDGKVTKISQKDKEDILNQNKAMAKRALRVLAFAYREMKNKNDKKEENLIFTGLIGLIDPPRNEVKKYIEICKKAGIKVAMVTGDQKDTAQAIATDLGIIVGTGKNIIEGSELNEMSDSELRKVVEEIDVYARVEPIQKLKIVDALQSNGRVVAMTGDGVNDAPALKKAEIGVSMGIKGTDVAKEASEMILEDDNFSSIVSAIEQGRIIYDNIKKFIQYLLSSNLGEVLILFIAMMIGFADPVTGQFIVPLTVIQILWINLVTDGLPALALSIDPGAKDIMERKPRDPNEKILSRSMVSDMLIVGIIMTISALWLFWQYLPIGIEITRTMVFSFLVVFEMVRIQGVRMKYKTSIFSNRKLIYAIVGTLIMQVIVVHLPLVQGIFETVPLGIYEWGLIIMLSAIGMAIMWVKNRFFG